MRGSPCRINAGPGRRHGCSPWHAELVESYRAARQAQLDRAEQWSSNYATELADYFDNVELPLTFRSWLEAHRCQLDAVDVVDDLVDDVVDDLAAGSVAA